MTHIWLKWAWRYSVLEVETFDTLEEALASAYYASEAGTEALDHIEGPEGRVADDVIEADQTRRSDAEYARYKAQPHPVITHHVRITTLDGTHTAVIGWHTSEADAVAEAAQWRETWGDRVSVVAAGRVMA